MTRAFFPVFGRAGALALCLASEGLAAEIAINPRVDASSVRKVAVIPFADDAAQRRISGEWETLLLAMGYRVLERGDLKALFKEHGLSLGGVVSAETAGRLGGLLGVEGLLVGAPNPRPPYHSYGLLGNAKISEPPPSGVRLIDAETGRLVWSVSGAGSSGDFTGQGTAVDGGLAESLKDGLREGRWKDFPAGRFRKGKFGKGVAVFNPKLRHSAGLKVGVYPFHTDGSARARQWEDEFGAILLEAGYDAVERPRLEKVLKEQGMSLTGAIRREDIRRLGKVAGLEGLAVGAVYDDSVCAYSVKLADVGTGELYWSAFGEDCSARRLKAHLKSFLSGDSSD